MPGLTPRGHQEWLGPIQPVGLVVAASALETAQIELDYSLKAKWLEYDALLTEQDGEKVLLDWTTFSLRFLEWTPDFVAQVRSAELPESLTVPLREFDDRLEPTAGILDPHRDGEWLLLIREESADSLDKIDPDTMHGWRASPQDRFERLLRSTKVGLGILVNAHTIRLVYAPGGESSGFLSFPIAAMARVDGRPMLLALYELLKGWRLSRACQRNRSLRAVLEDSRRYQNKVSAALAEQVLGALYELAAGFQAADDAVGNALLQETLSNAPDEVYGGLLTSIMRLVFVLYAEERGMLPQEAAWVENYGVGALFERLRSDKARHPDTMDLRFAAWPRLLTLFRTLHDGASHGRISLPAREGDLFDPDKYPFLEGRPWQTRRVIGDRLTRLPRVSDGTVLRVLERLVVLNGERLSYRSLDVEQIGSVYESMMGFEIRAASGRSVAVKPKTKKQGSPSHPVVDLDALLALNGEARIKWLKDEADCELPAKEAAKLRDSSSVDGLFDALDRRISPYTPQPIHRGALALMPTEERRRSGSHYTPRELTEPIVATTLQPLLEAMGDVPTPEQLLDLRVCDPAMGSGAFLVGACRYLGDQLAKAWQRSGAMPTIPPDEDAELFARRIIAQQCLYGVDRNPHAVQLAKLSLWLVTLAREHPFTFVDHALRCGDSLVGLSQRQITCFHWVVKGQASIFARNVEERVTQAVARREQIEQLAATDDTKEKKRLLEEAEAAQRFVRLTGDAAVAAFFRETTAKKRESRRQENEELVAASISEELDGSRLAALSEEMRSSEPPLVPFHWDVEFAEVFQRPNPGFDAIVGNPPFAGKNTLIKANPERYLDWLQTVNEGAHGNSDLVAHFFRRAFTLLRKGGAFGLIATNTISQGDTRATGLRWICQNGGTLFHARRRYKWPGAAAVVVSVVHALRGNYAGTKTLDGRDVERITAFLFHAGGDDDPAPLPENDGKSFIGSYLLGMGFTFDDDNDEATPIAEMERLIRENPKNAEVVFPYIGGEEVNDSPTHAHRRYVINFGEMSESDARTGWPALMRIVEKKVRPKREKDNRASYRKYWWQFAEKRIELRAAIERLESVLAASRHSEHLAWGILPSSQVFAESLVVLALRSSREFAIVHSRVHETWSRFFGSSLETRFRYTPTDCFETFPFPDSGQSDALLERRGREYSDFRLALMRSNNQGLTATYNRFNDQNETDHGILELRRLHEAMDRAVLDAYEWSDLRPFCDFLLDYEEDEEGEDARSRRTKAWRYRWPDEVRDEVLARLLDLNRKRAVPSKKRQTELF